MGYFSRGTYGGWLNNSIHSMYFKSVHFFVRSIVVKTFETYLGSNSWLLNTCKFHDMDQLGSLLRRCMTSSHCIHFGHVLYTILVVRYSQWHSDETAHMDTPHGLEPFFHSLQSWLELLESRDMLPWQWYQQSSISQLKDLENIFLECER